MEGIVWIAEDQSGDLFFEGDEIAKQFTKDAGILPICGFWIAPPLWERFVRQWIEEHPDAPTPSFYYRTFRKRVAHAEVQTREWPLYLDIDEDTERFRLARWKVLAALSLDRVLPCPVCHEGWLAPDGERLRCLRCEHGPSDWQRRP